MRGQAEQSRIKGNATQYEEQDPGLLPQLGSKSAGSLHCKSMAL